MKLFQALSFLIAAAAVAQIACSDGGGFQHIEGNQCPNWDAKTGPISIDAAPGQEKLSLKAGEPNNKVAAGSYAYQRADIFYIDNSGFRIQMRDVAVGEGQYAGRVTCVRNATDASAATAFSTKGMYTMKVEGETPVATERTYTFSIANDGKYVFDFNSPPGEDAPTKTYPVESDYSFLKNSESSYELRSVGTTPHGRYWIIIHYGMTPPAPPAAPAPEPVPEKP